ncbi:5-formyltetrahydrofolate cyclo-ligase [Flavobacteriaceae bacterium LMO-SS05]
MTKAELRNLYKLKRSALTAEVLEDLSLKIANQLLTLSIWDKAFYHVFLSIQEHKEVQTDYILNILSGKDKHIVISKSNFKIFEMTHYLLTDNTVLKKNHFNIPEPLDGIEILTDKVEVVFVPLLAFDRQGHRVGYGKGFYDKFLSECQPNTLKIGLAFFEAELSIDDVMETDVRLDYCVTPEQIYKF